MYIERFLSLAQQRNLKIYSNRKSIALSNLIESMDCFFIFATCLNFKDYEKSINGLVFKVPIYDIFKTYGRKNAIKLYKLLVDFNTCFDLYQKSIVEYVGLKKDYGLL